MKSDRKGRITGKAKRKAFLAAFAQIGSLRAAARAANCARASHYVWLKDPEYAAQYEVAREEALDRLEWEARLRAEHGIEEPVIYKGQQCYGPLLDEEGNVVLGEDGKPTMVPLTVRKYSDTLMMFLLKGQRPENYRDNSSRLRKKWSRALSTARRYP